MIQEETSAHNRRYHFKANSETFMNWEEFGIHENKFPDNPSKNYAEYKISKISKKEQKENDSRIMVTTETLLTPEILINERIRFVTIVARNAGSSNADTRRKKEKMRTAIMRIMWWK